MRRLAAAAFLILPAIPVMRNLPPAEAGTVRLTEETWIRVEIRPLGVDGEETRTFGTQRLDIPPARPGELSFRLPWPDPESGGRLVLNARDVSPSGEGALILALDSVWKPAGGTPARAARTVTFEDDRSQLLEVFARDRLHLTLVLRAERITRPVVARPSPGRKIDFHLTVEKLVEGQVVPLETNDLESLVGESVEYSFRRGEGETLETLRLFLKPLRITGELVELEVAFEGSLHGPGSPLILSRRETLWTSRHAVTLFDAASGKPPTGYRFRILPRF